jgi:ornithine cyclodeaminase/alanine dehydrogenase-like protein (mu-crystallin family)
MLVLSQADVEAVLDPRRLVDALATAMQELSAGACSMPSRLAAMVDEKDGLLAAMPAYLPSAGALTTKLVTLFPHNEQVPTHQAVICCFDPTTGSPVAVMDGTAITAVRTAAGSALATRLLARPGARTLLVIGTGVQARAHLRAVGAEMGSEDIVVAGRDPARVGALVAELHDIKVRAADDLETAVRRADVVCATTHADTPVVRREWLRPGVHVNSVGYNAGGQGEVDAATVRDARVIVESRSAAFAPPPTGAVELRGVDPAAVVEIGEILGGTVTGRKSGDEITLYKSMGVAVQDAAAAALVLAAARERHLGTELSM